MPPTPDPTFLARYLSGECTLNERLAIEARIASDSAFAAELERLRAAWTRGVAEERYDASALWERVAADTVNAAPRAQPSDRPRLVGTRRKYVGESSRWLWQIAAVLIVSAGAVGTWIWSGEAAKVAVPALRPPREYAAVRGQRAELRLADGTRVVLAPESRLTVPAQYDSVGRAVSLEGQAYFDVAHDAARPFVVRAGNASIRDLGTRFDVRAFANEKSVRVVVTHGKVSLDTTLLGAGDVARLRETGESSVARGVDTTRYVAWTRGELVFDRTPIRDALAELGRWYDIDIRLADTSLDERRLTATLRDEPLSDVLSGVALSLGARVERRDRVVILHALK